MIVVNDRPGLKKTAKGFYGVPEAENERLTGWRSLHQRQIESSGTSFSPPPACRDCATIRRRAFAAVNGGVRWPPTTTKSLPTLRSPGFKFLLIVLLTVAMAIPLFFIQLALFRPRKDRCRAPQTISPQVGAGRRWSQGLSCSCLTRLNARTREWTANSGGAELHRDAVAGKPEYRCACDIGHALARHLRGAGLQSRDPHACELRQDGHRRPRAFRCESAMERSADRYPRVGCPWTCRQCGAQPQWPCGAVRIRRRCE